MTRPSDYLLDFGGFSQTFIHWLAAFLEVKSIEEVGDLFATIITLCIKPSLKIFNALSKMLHIKAIYSIYNPILFILVVLPQLFYLFLSNLPIIKSIFKRFRYGPIGYVSIAQKST